MERFLECLEVDNWAIFEKELSLERELLLVSETLITLALGLLGAQAREEDRDLEDRGLSDVESPKPVSYTHLDVYKRQLGFFT